MWEQYGHLSLGSSTLITFLIIVPSLKAFALFPHHYLAKFSRHIRRESNPQLEVASGTLAAAGVLAESTQNLLFGRIFKSELRREVY
jgi:hypothetical protein